MERTHKWQMAVYPNALATAGVLWHSVSKHIAKRYMWHHVLLISLFLLSSNLNVLLYSLQFMNGILPFCRSPKSGHSSAKTSVAPVESETEADTGKVSKKTNLIDSKAKKSKSENRPSHMNSSWISWVESQWSYVIKYQDAIANICWRLIEIHIGKLIAFVMIWLCVHEVIHYDIYEESLTKRAGFGS
jgi:hypothetical protein